MRLNRTKVQKSKLDVETVFDRSAKRIALEAKKHIFALVVSASNDDDDLETEIKS